MTGPDRLTIGIVATGEYGHKHFNATAFTVFIVNDLKLVTGKVNVYLVIGIMLNMPHDMSHHPVTHEIITETGMFVSIRACFVILFVQGFDRYPSAAKTGGVLGWKCLQLKLAL